MSVRSADVPASEDNVDLANRRNIRAAGTHAIIELYHCPFALLDDEAHVRNTIRQAAEAAEIHLLKLTSHGFSPHGVTALGLLAESHISIHTWPEIGYAAADMFTCGKQYPAVAATELLVRRFRAGRHSAQYLVRGERLLTQDDDH
ncbi:MAG: adenosylmethionine decarboxylase [Desulfobacteraceae bacterium]|jgi:S-adenosylmethionine decarboxylase